MTRVKQSPLFSLVFLALLILCLASEAPAAITVPALSGRVNDYANILSSATRQQLETTLAAFEKKESTQIVILIIPSLERAVIEEYALKVAETWRLGQKGRDNGALLLIAKNDRKLRIEVGYGLEGSLTDLTSGRIIRDIITPKFRSGNFDQGVIDGIGAMLQAVKGEFAAEQATTAQGSPNDGDLAGLIIFLIFAFFNLGKFTGKHLLLAALLGAIIAPVIGVFFLGFQWFALLLLIIAGLICGFLANLIFGRSHSSGGGRSASSGGFSSSGSSSFSDSFSGGGGGFGGGGSSGGW